MKLLVCASEYYPHGAGIANVVYNVVEELKGKGVECTVCSPTGPDIKLGSQALIKRTGIIGLLNYWHNVSRYFKHSDYDAVWLHNPFFLIKNPFSHCLVTMHSTYTGSSAKKIGSVPYCLYKSFVASIERHCLTKMPSVVSFTGVSESVCEELEKIGIARNRTTYIPNGANVKQFHSSPDKNGLRKKFGIPEDDLVILSVGRLTPAKRPYTLIEVFSYLEKELGDVTLCIAGKGELFAKVKELAERKELCKVHFLGHLDHNQDLPDLYGCSDYFITTSKYEGGQPTLSLAEAMASGLPCIVSNIPNHGVVKDADCGLIVDFTDIEISVNSILDYLSINHDEHKNNARDYATKSLGWDIIAEKYIHLLRGV